MDGEGRYIGSLGLSIRQFFRDLFGSRFIEHLETSLIQLRQDFDQRIQDKDKEIAALKEEKALLTSKITIYEMTLMPHASRAGAEVVAYSKPKKPNFEFFDSIQTKSRWEQYQEDYYKSEEAREAAEKAEKAKNKDTAATAKG